jgi:hypothetical protein
VSNNTAFALNKTTISSIAANETANFTVYPNTSLAAGDYSATVTVSGDSVISKSFSVSFTVTPPVDGWTSLAPALAYLDAKTGGSTVDNPFPLKLNVNLVSSTDGWYALVTALANKNKYVSLDLSNCAVNSGAFDSGANGVNGTGAAKIVSLVLPDSATSIAVGSTGMKVYTRLKTVSGANISTIGNIFSDCTSLTTVSFPEATSIGNQSFQCCTALTTVSFPKVTSIAYAFYGCTSLTTVSIPEATSIGPSAFYSCAALTTVSFPEATSIGGYAFQGCTSLTTVSFPEATSIGGYAFQGCTALWSASFPEATSIGNYAFDACTALATVSFPKVTDIGAFAFTNSGKAPLVITMGAVAPTVGTYMFYGIDGSRNVTVRVPSGATGYDDTWKTAFRGKGSSNNGTVVNSNINLVVVEY